MIFVTLGTQDKSFIRLLQAIDHEIEIGTINEEVIVQAGYTKYHSKHMEIFDYVSIDVFAKYLNDCDLVITHGGVGSILQSVMLQKKVIAVARLADMDEHENDHQIEVVSRFEDLGYILGCIEVGALHEKLLALEHFKPKPYQSNNVSFCNLIREKIDNI